MAARGEKTTFADFVKRQQQSAKEAETAFDASRELADWLRHLDDLYGMIEAWLDEYVKSGAISISYKKIAMNEEFIGAYTAREMALKIGRNEITLTPIGTVLIGTKGRVDVIGPAGRTRLMLVDKDATRPSVKTMATVIGPEGQPQPQQEAQPARPKEITWVWKIATPPPLIQFVELTPESLYSSLIALVND